MIGPKPRRDAVRTRLGILPREARRVERADKPIGGLGIQKRGQFRIKLVVIATAIGRGFRPACPLRFADRLIKASIKGPYLAVGVVGLGGGEVRSYIWRARPVKNPRRHPVMPEDHQRDDVVDERAALTRASKI